MKKESSLSEKIATVNDLYEDNLEPTPEVVQTKDIKQAVKRLKELIIKVIKEMDECKQLEMKANEKALFENGRLQKKAWAELFWALEEIDKIFGKGLVE